MEFTLPDDWAELAAALAEDSDSNPANNPRFWDIHDDQLKTEDHPALLAMLCRTELAERLAIDAVDNCNGGGDEGPRILALVR